MFHGSGSCSASRSTLLPALICTSQAANFSGQSWTLDLRRLDDNHSYPSIFSKVYLGDTSNHWYVGALFHHREPRKLHDSQSMPVFDVTFYYACCLLFQLLGITLGKGNPQTQTTCNSRDWLYRELARVSLRKQQSSSLRLTTSCLHCSKLYPGNDWLCN